MLLTEQKYTNLNRSYFHGARTGKIEKAGSMYSYFYLTNNFAYAAMHACDYDAFEGRVFEFKLKEGLNIFNARSKADILKIRTYAKKHLPELGSDWYWEGLFDEDWSILLNSFNLKTKVIECLKNCNYDGFFDYEWTPKYKEKNRITKGEKLQAAPTIGIFDIQKLRQVAVYEYKDDFKFESFSNAYKEEKQDLNSYAVGLKSNSIEDIYDMVLGYAQDNFLFLTEKDLDEAVQNIDRLVEGKDYKRTIYNSYIFNECVKNGTFQEYELNRYYQIRRKPRRDKLRSLGYDPLESDTVNREMNRLIHPKKHLFEKSSKKG